MIKLIASDMDGTLLNNNKKLDDEFYETLNLLKDKNIIFAFASGREIHSLKRLVKKEYINDIMYISNNGSYIWYKGKEIYKKIISLNDIKNINNYIKNIKNLKTIVCTTDAIYTNSIKNFIIGRMRGYKHIYTKKYENLSGEPLKFTIFSEELKQEEILKELEPIKDEFNITPSGKKTIDIVAKDVNKGIAIAEIQNIFNVSIYETVVFGDYLNDLEMMEKAYFSHAMENAHPELKEKANFLAGHNDEKGVIKKIEQLLKEENLSYI